VNTPITPIYAHFVRRPLERLANKAGLHDF